MSRGADSPLRALMHNKSASVEPGKANFPPFRIRIQPPPLTKRLPILRLIYAIVSNNLELDMHLTITISVVKFTFYQFSIFYHKLIN